MRVTIELPETLVANVRGNELPFEITNANSVETLSEIVRRLALYGLRKFNDASPMGETAPTDEVGKQAFKARCAENARAMMNDWLVGDFATERGGRQADPLTQKAREIARMLVVKKYGKVTKDATDEAKAEFAKRVSDASRLDKIIALAKAELAKANDLADLI